MFICLPEDKNMMSLSGKILMTCDLSRRYGIKDIDGEHSSKTISGM